MSDASMPNQATEPDQDTAASQQAQLHAPPNPGGSAVLDANIAAGEVTNPEGEALTEPIASNFSSATGTRDAKTANVSTVAGPYSVGGDESGKGDIHLQNDPNPPDNTPKGMPDTDPVKLPLDPDINLPD